tara:strand:+ start:3203 stop:3460 length:258 start_codon:yes stop_codon:yes gene_type:complete
MYKIFNMTMISIVLIFIFYIFQHYTSNKNIIEKDYKRLNLDKLLNEKISDLPILKNDTTNVIEFNNSLENENNKEKKRSFWELLK